MLDPSVAPSPTGSIVPGVGTNGYTVGEQFFRRSAQARQIRFTERVIDRFFKRDARLDFEILSRYF